MTAHRQLQQSSAKARAAQHRAAFSVNEFCEQHGISRTLFYGLQRDGHGPRLMRAGGRTLVSVEAATEWRQAMEQTGRAAP
jgi:predicted DNA-binding transcriptional regulator AlpA